LPMVMGNFRSLQQVFMNLLMNALQAMPEGGEISVAAETDSRDTVRVDIHDTGMGISQELVQHIFEPFFTTKEVGKGTGLGLAVVYSLVKKHGGRIDVNSEIGRGTTFSVFLPTASSRSSVCNQISEVL
jgi:two-component system, NtrC family, sensor kinase